LTEAVMANSLASNIWVLNDFLAGLVAVFMS